MSGDAKSDERGRAGYDRRRHSRSMSVNGVYLEERSAMSRLMMNAYTTIPDGPSPSS